MMSRLSGAKLSSQPTFSRDDRMCRLGTLSVVAIRYLRQLTLSLSPRCVDVLTLSSDLVVEQCSKSEPEDARALL